jgi:hypothetical protein
MKAGVMERGPAHDTGSRARQRPSARRWWAPGDVLIAAAVVALSVFLILQGITEAGGGGSMKAVISVNGQVVREVPLTGGEQELTVRGYQGDSLVEISGGRVRMIDSACPDKLCVKTGWISSPGKSIVCLPNRVVIEVVGGDGGPDAVNQ